jgi:NAD(P)-dependent dehydrogenase (short-subunit alcohol dehydrogenase family)
VTITGGGGGMGLAAAFRFGQDHPLVLADVDDGRLRLAVEQLRGAGVTATGVLCDITRASDLVDLANATRRAGPLGLLFHTAGLSPSMADARRVLEVNLFGTAGVLEAFTPQLTTGSLAVCVASFAAYKQRVQAFAHLVDDLAADGALDRLVAAAGGGSRAAYALSKYGVQRLCSRLAARFAERGARIVSISPGVVDTDMSRLEARSAGLANTAAMTARSPLGRAARAEEIAAFVSLLVRPEAACVTGCDLLVDGGMLADVRHHAADDVRAAFDDPWR